MVVTVATGITRALISVRLLDRLVVTAVLVVLVAVWVTVVTVAMAVLVRRAVTVLMV